MAREHYDVNGKVVFITGASRGIGAEAARRMAARGAHVALVGLEPDELLERAAELGPRAAAFEADVTDRDAIQQAVDAVVDRFGGIDVVFANAGISTTGTVATMAPEEFERVIEINLFGVWRTIRAALPHVVDRQGYILANASLSAILHGPLIAHYEASKAGVETFAKALGLEIAHTGTKVGVAYFGFVDTDLVREGFADPATEPLRSRGPSFLTRPIPVAQAGAAIERGIERRARAVCAPGWVRTALYSRGLLEPLISRSIRGDATTIEAVRRAESGVSTEPVQHVEQQQ